MKLTTECVSYLAHSLYSQRIRKCSFAICCRPSVCLSVVCLSVTLVHPTQAVVNFGNFSTALPWPSTDTLGKFYGDRPSGTSPSGELNARGVAKCGDFGHIEVHDEFLGKCAR